MRILIIPDIHCRNFWRKAIDNNIDKVDKVIFLGDYLDPYPDEFKIPDNMECKSYYDTEGILNMMNDIISLKKNEPNKYILLCGNHVSSYIWPEFGGNNRTDRNNWKLYHNFFKENLTLFNFVWRENNAIFSHAGITEGWANEFLRTLEYEDETLQPVSECAQILIDTPLTDFNEYYLKRIGDISDFRGGDMFYGSCEWADIREHIKKITSYKDNTFEGNGEEGIYQIFGHTQLNYKPLICDKWACLDCKRGFIVDTITYECQDCL